MNTRLVIVLLWVLSIVIATCTSDARAFLFDQEVDFRFDLTPNFSELLRLDDISFSDSFYLTQKTGHFLSFALLYVLVLNWLKKSEVAFVITAAFAVFTEILQLFFERDGRFFDMGVDLLGILLAYSVLKIIANVDKAAAKDSY
ncbi:VanZ family protein [Planococcus shenhongbingii]|uniref:VanZ family protein n=1 Tax=Planococcus shenhongbingii TaxID=3058398 RepID=UPI002616A1F0|nr:VanZ family protein [Planococcus sp. N016]WKA57730.1 VanZ family protein [Planococcus sp. N016]